MDTTFFQAFLDEPFCKTLRRVYADWLEDRGDPRAEMFRTESGLFTTPGHYTPEVEECRKALLQQQSQPASAEAIELCIHRLGLALLEAGYPEWYHLYQYQWQDQMEYQQQVLAHVMRKPVT